MDGTREERLYHLQNWRGDVVKLISAAGGGRQVEGARYSSYGIPWGIALRDIDGDGDVDTDDSDFMIAWSGVSYDVRGDFDLDGDVDMDDEILFNADSTPGLGWGNLSNLASRKGYAGYEHDGNFDVLAHVRNRVYASDLGRWTRRDPAGFVDGMNLYGYVQGNPVGFTDSSGHFRISGVLNSADSVQHELAGESKCMECTGYPCVTAPECVLESEDSIYGAICKTACERGGRVRFGNLDCESRIPVSCCICDETIGDTYSDSQAQMIMQECTRAHESEHVSQCRCGAMEWLPRACREVNAHDRAIECLERALYHGGCLGNSVCNDQVADRLEKVRQARRLEYWSCETGRDPNEVIIQ